MDKLILVNNTEVTIQSLSSLSDIKVISDTKYDMISVWDMLTEDNLKTVQIKNSEGLVLANYSDLVFVSETSTVIKNENNVKKILTSFHLREKTDVEKRLDALEDGQEVQDGAIMDLGEVVSELSEEVKNVTI